MSGVSFVRVFLSMVLLWIANIFLTTAVNVSFKIEGSDVKHHLHPWFLSLGMDSNLIRDRWETFDFNSVRLKTLARGLQPAYLRLMGTDGDRMIFTRTNSSLFAPSSPSYTSYPFPPTNFSMFPSDWDAINQFAASVGWRLLFGFNLQLRQGKNWDPQNARSILQYSIKKGYNFNMDFELGNEPDLYLLHPHMVPLTGTQIAEDYKALRDILDREFRPYYRSSIIAGPGLANGGSVDFLLEFLNGLGNETIHAVTWHQYYGGAEINHVDNFTDPAVLDKYLPPLKYVLSTVNKSTLPDIPIWQGETSSTYAPPPSDICETYVAGFMLLDKLGLSSDYGMRLVVRQTFYGFWFALVNNDLNPTPNYWTALLYKTFVGNKVLDLQITGQGSPRNIRAYCHCAVTSYSALTIPRGSVIVYAMNLGESDANLTFSVQSGSGSISTMKEFLLTPGDDQGMLSKKLKLNGQVIDMAEDDALPYLVPRDVTEVILPAKSYAFYILADAKARACLDQ